MILAARRAFSLHPPAVTSNFLHRSTEEQRLVAVHVFQTPSVLPDLLVSLFSMCSSMDGIILPTLPPCEMEDSPGCVPGALRSKTEIWLALIQSQFVSEDAITNVRHLLFSFQIYLHFALSPICSGEEEPFGLVSILPGRMSGGVLSSCTSASSCMSASSCGVNTNAVDSKLNSMAWENYGLYHMKRTKRGEVSIE